MSPTVILFSQTHIGQEVVGLHPKQFLVGRVCFSLLPRDPVLSTTGGRSRTSHTSRAPKQRDRPGVWRRR